MRHGMCLIMCFLRATGRVSVLCTAVRSPSLPRLPNPPLSHPEAALAGKSKSQQCRSFRGLK